MRNGSTASEGSYYVGVPVLLLRRLLHAVIVILSSPHRKPPLVVVPMLNRPPSCNLQLSPTRVTVPWVTHLKHWGLKSRTRLSIFVAFIISTMKLAAPMGNYLVGPDWKFSCRCSLSPPPNCASSSSPTPPPAPDLLIPKSLLKNCKGTSCSELNIG